MADIDQLSEAQKLLWSRLSVFDGSFSLEAIEAVCTGAGITPGSIRNLIAGLVDRKLVEIEKHDQETRYRLAESHAPSARASLIEGGEEDVVFSRLVEWHCALAEQSLEEAFGPQRATWMKRLEDEHINLRGSLGWLVAQGDSEQGLRLAYLLQELWFEDAHMGEGRKWFAALLALPNPTRNIMRSQTLDLAGALALFQLDYAEARRLQEEGVAILREIGDRTAIGYRLMHLGHTVAFGQRDFVHARALYQESLEIFREMGDNAGIAHALGNLGSAALELGDYAAAGPLVEESLRRYRALEMRWEMAFTLGRVGGVAAGNGHRERALRLGGASAAHREAIGVTLPPIYGDHFDRMLEPARAALDATAQATAWDAGRAMTLEEAVAYALEERVDK
jgi:tetratricopeptide (TPR) repeat protein